MLGELFSAPQNEGSRTASDFHIFSWTKNTFLFRGQVARTWKTKGSGCQLIYRPPARCLIDGCWRCANTVPLIDACIHVIDCFCRCLFVDWSWKRFFFFLSVPSRRGTLWSCRAINRSARSSRWRSPIIFYRCRNSRVILGQRPT